MIFIEVVAIYYVTRYQELCAIPYFMPCLQNPGNVVIEEGDGEWIDLMD